MKFNEVSKTFAQIEQISSRLEITRLLAELFKKASPQDAKILSYMALGTLNPPYISTRFSIASKTILKIVARIAHASEDEVREQLEKVGDIGTVIEHFKNSIVLNENKNLTVQMVYITLQAIEAVEGSGSQEEKIVQVCDLLLSLDYQSIKYVLRVILGTLRLGFSDMTLVDALSWMQAGDKSLRPVLEHAYTVCADIGLIAYELKHYGVDAIKAMHIHVGIPIRPAAAERLENAAAIIEKIGPCVVQPKLDGFRLQVHVDNTGDQPIIRFFSRNLLDMSSMFPEFVEICKKLPVSTFIADGEAIVYDPNTGIFLPFQETVKRKRKHGIEELVSELPLQLNLFDILYLDGKDFLHTQHDARRHTLEQIYNQYLQQQIGVVKPTTNKQLSLFESPQSAEKEMLGISIQTLQIIQEIHVSTAQELETYFYKEISAGLEGIVAKKIHSLYQAGKRNFNWIKLKYQATSKLEDSIDVVILGYYPGRGKRAHFGIGAFLVGVYNEKVNVFQTVAKVGTGLTDQEWIEIKALCDNHTVMHQPKDVVCAKDLYPAVWIEPVLVCEVLADEITISPLHTAGKTEHTLGFALRFPRFLRHREDKSVYQTTTISELAKMHKRQ